MNPKGFFDTQSYRTKYRTNRFGGGIPLQLGLTEAPAEINQSENEAKH